MICRFREQVHFITDQYDWFVPHKSFDAADETSVEIENIHQLDDNSFLVTDFTYQCKEVIVRHCDILDLIVMLEPEAALTDDLIVFP